jgi:hypothetical protein
VNLVYAAALELQAFCGERGWRFCFIGGIAVQRWGEPRLTVDADLTLLTGFGKEEPYVDALLAGFRARVDGAREFALRRRVLLLQAANSVALDVSLGGIALEERIVGRSSDFPIPPEHSLRTCSAEDLIVLKAVAARDRDWADIRGVVARQAAKLDRRLIESELRPLLELKDDRETAERLRRLLEEAGKP